MAKLFGKETDRKDNFWGKGGRSPVTAIVPKGLRTPLRWSRGERTGRALRQIFPAPWLLMELEGPLASIYFFFPPPLGLKGTYRYSRNIGSRGRIRNWNLSVADVYLGYEGLQEGDGCLLTLDLFQAMVPQPAPHLPKGLIAPDATRFAFGFLTRSCP